MDKLWRQFEKMHLKMTKMEEDYEELKNPKSGQFKHRQIVKVKIPERKVIICIKTTGPIYNLSKIKPYYLHSKPEKEDRVIEISCIEVIDDKPSDNTYHTFINPECEVSETATNLHGIKSEFL